VNKIHETIHKLFPAITVSGPPENYYHFLLLRFPRARRIIIELFPDWKIIPKFGKLQLAWEGIIYIENDNG
jgi:hypothetical protein